MNTVLRFRIEELEDESRACLEGAEQLQTELLQRAAAVSPPSAVVRKSSTAVGAPKAKRFRRTKDELAAGLSVQQAKERRTLAVSAAPTKKRRKGDAMRKIEPCPTDAAMVRGAFSLSLPCVCLTANSHLSCLR